MRRVAEVCRSQSKQQLFEQMTGQPIPTPQHHGKIVLPSQLVCVCAGAYNTMFVRRLAACGPFIAHAGHAGEESGTCSGWLVFDVSVFLGHRHSAPSTFFSGRSARCLRDRRRKRDVGLCCSVSRRVRVRWICMASG